MAAERSHAMEARMEGVTAAVEAVGLSEDPGQNLKLDQATFFRCVENGNLSALGSLLKNRKVDVNAYNDEGVTSLHLAVYKYEETRNLDMIKFLLAHGADVSLKAAVLPSAHKISIIRHAQAGHHGTPIETKKVTLDQKTPLQVALELKSTLYLKGWEYRHWDDMLHILAEASIDHYGKSSELKAERSSYAQVQKNWAAIFASGKHETVEVWAEDKSITVLTLLLSGSSKILKLNLENPDVQYSNRLDIKEASFNITKAMMKFLYTGMVEAEFMKHRGLDLLSAAHKYGITSLKQVCEDSIFATQDNWIKLLNTATECNSDALALKCAESIKEEMTKRHDKHIDLSHTFSDVKHAPNQLFSSR
ncbi:hypothetical protein M758_9G038000 [Ceratodon purpureus]|nr:hypothetical protein M758_9G038000 [Ceratodon purpureus]